MITNNNLSHINPGDRTTRNFVFNHYLQAWILAPDIGQCPVKNRVMSGEACFTTDTAARCEFEKKL